MGVRKTNMMCPLNERQLQSIETQIVIQTNYRPMTSIFYRFGIGWNRFSDYRYVIAAFIL